MKSMRDFEELHSITTDISPPTDILIFSSKKFRVIRLFLRLLSLWRPRSAGFFENYLYPVTVNLLLLTVGLTRDLIRATENPRLLSIQVLYIVHEVVVWLGHILGNRYFASRDLETNVLRSTKSLSTVTKLLNRRLKVLNSAVIISMTFFSIMLCALYSVTELKWNKGAERFSAELPHVHGPVDHILYCLVLILIIYNLGIGLALVWTLALLFCFYTARLKILEKVFLNWKDSSADAVALFIHLYTRPLKNSWKRMSLWFLAHNIVALAIPLYGYELAQAVSGREYHSKHLPQFICYLVFVITIWLAPIVVGEQIKRRERKFLERINDISPWLPGTESPTKISAEGSPLGERRGETVPIATDDDHPHHTRQSPSPDSDGSTSAECPESCSKNAEYTFVSRGKELKKFLRFLKERTPGFVSRGYSLQLNLSLISLTGGAISFLTKLHTKNSEDVMYEHCNCTMS